MIYKSFLKPWVFATEILPIGSHISGLRLMMNSDDLCCQICNVGPQPVVNIVITPISRVKFHPSYPFIFGVFSPFVTGSGAYLVTLTVVLSTLLTETSPPWPLTSRRPGRSVRFWHGEEVPHLSSWTWAHVASALMYDWRGLGRWKVTINMNMHSKKKQTWNSFWD